MSVSAHALFITDDSRVIFTQEFPGKTFTLINDTAYPVSLNVSLPTLNEQTVSRSCQSWIQLLTDNVTLPGNSVTDYKLEIEAPELVSENTIWNGMVRFAYAYQQVDKPVWVFYGRQREWLMKNGR